MASDSVWIAGKEKNSFQGVAVRVSYFCFALAETAYHKAAEAIVASTQPDVAVLWPAKPSGTSINGVTRTCVKPLAGNGELSKHRLQ